MGSSSIYTFLTKNEITYELGFATDGKNDITSDVKENMTIQYLMKNVKETYEVRLLRLHHFSYQN